MKYEMIFGDESLFDGAPDDCFCVAKNVYDNPVFYKSENLSLFWLDGEKWKPLSFMSCPPIAMRRIIKTPVQHSDDVAVDLFAAKMKEKLEKSRYKGRSGWESCPIEHLIDSLKDHISKGDPVDVANFAMMISQRGESIKTPVWTVSDQLAGKMPEVGSIIVGCSSNTDYEVIKKTSCGIVIFSDNPKDTVGYYDNKDVFLFFKPIETTEEKAQREEDEFVVAMLDAASQEQLMSAGFKSGVIAAYRKLKGGE